MKKIMKIEDEPRRKKKRKRHQNKNEKMKSIIIDIEKEIEEQLDTKAEDNDFTTTNVKGILKELIMDEDMKEMVRQTLHPGDSSRRYEPKLTRAKVRKLLELRPDLKIPILWPISQNNTNFVSECLSLINEDYSENSSEDEEYRPDDDKNLYLDFSFESELNSVDSKSSQKKSFNVKAKSVCVTSESEITEVEENIGQRTRSKLPLTETRLEDIEQTFNPPDITVDMYDCDIDNEDYLNFLREFCTSDGCGNSELEDAEDDLDDDPEYRIPVDSETVDKEELRRDRGTEVPSTELWQLINEIIGDNESLKSVSDRKKLSETNIAVVDTCKSNSVKNLFGDSTVESRESLMVPSQEITNICYSLPSQSYERPCVELLPSDTNQNGCTRVQPPSLFEQQNVKAISNNSDVDGSFLTKPQKLLFEQQLRQHVQLTTMHFLQCYKHATLHQFAKELKNLLVTLQLLAGSNKKSAYYASNLYGALKLIDDWEKITADVTDLTTNIRSQKKRTGRRRCFPSDLMKTICKSNVFLYPLLLPDKPFFDHIEKISNRREITKSEEWLLTIGLQQFHDCINKQMLDKNRSTVRETLKLIIQYLLPLFTPSFLHSLLKKKSSDDPSNSSIGYYFKHKTAPPLKHFVVPVLPSPLYEQPFDLLPKIWQDYILENFVVIKRK